MVTFRCGWDLSEVGAVVERKALRRGVRDGVVDLPSMPPQERKMASVPTHERKMASVPTHKRKMASVPTHKRKMASVLPHER